ncbi:MAG: hypothetical protein AB1458_13085 [Bacteroidota bacterium]
MFFNREAFINYIREHDNFYKSVDISKLSDRQLALTKLNIEIEKQNDRQKVVQSILAHSDSVTSHDLEKHSTQELRETFHSMLMDMSNAIKRMK